MKLFSPRMRGCFSYLQQQAKKIKVLPAYAGMFPEEKRVGFEADRSPRVCGDVSGPLDVLSKLSQFSPRMRGCFHLSQQNQQRQEVLPAYAGMFLSLAFF